MIDFVQTYWPAVVAAAVLALLIAWWLRARARRPSARAHRPDVLDEGAAPARRNQALIDSPIAATIVPPVTLDRGSPVADPSPALAETPSPAGNGEAIAWEAEERDGPAGPAPTPDGDDLGKLKGVGPKLVTALTALGITRYAQIAAWDEADIDRVDAQLGPFAGRIRRDAWVEQACFLASGDVSGYEGRFGRL